ncbi:MAG: glycosyl transferase, group 1 [Terriglobia bacterium]|nr:MAG: glycosyl transferase, group 1 [Terriglobia bacterium]
MGRGPAVKAQTEADVCLVLEGTYPFVAGGVSHWTHELMLAQPDLRFHLVCLVAPNADLTPRYSVPPNVSGITTIEVGRPPEGCCQVRCVRELFERLEAPLRKLFSGGGLDAVKEVLQQLGSHRGRLGKAVLLDSAEAWQVLLRLYHRAYHESAFLDYFWTWRMILSGFYSIALADVPPARVYHPLSTGYAGLFAVRARLVTGRPVLLTEHGIYTNERRIEIALADWLYQAPCSGLRLQKPAGDLKDMWMEAFTCYSRACYEAASRILTLYGGNQQFQLEDGADASKLGIIPNGVDYNRFSALQPAEGERPPAVALIGRVVPVKDVKTYIRAIAILRELVPDVRALVLGPTEEDPQYFAECQALVNHLALQGCFTFAGRVPVAEHLPRLDVVVLTSISEAQPLVVLEAGAAGIPSVVTDVGACREMIHGDSREKLPLRAGGEVTPLANPTATAMAIARLLKNRPYRENAGQVMRERVRAYYNKPELDRAYRQLYKEWCAAGPLPPLPEAG